MEGGDVCGPVVGYDTSGTIRNVGCDVLIESVDEFLARVVAQNDLDVTSDFCRGVSGNPTPTPNSQNTNFVEGWIMVEIEALEVICEEYG